MSALSGVDVMFRFQKLFIKLNGSDKPTFLRTVTDGATARAAKTHTDLDIRANCLVGKAEYVQRLMTAGYTLVGKLTFTVWPGVLDPVGDPTNSENLLKAAQKPGGGILYGGILYDLEDFTKDDVLGGQPQLWHLICTSQRIQQVK